MLNNVIFIELNINQKRLLAAFVVFKQGYTNLQ
ncbi:hypothetical protein X564_16240 [Pseudoalteromonas agarivorans]|nr:hypothetical protein X564_16240 [Pseudoalteromonas agarivorans]